MHSLTTVALLAGLENTPIGGNPLPVGNTILRLVESKLQAGHGVTPPSPFDILSIGESDAPKSGAFAFDIIDLRSR